MFGKNFVWDYSNISLDSVNLVRELRDNSLFVPGFQSSELNLFVHVVTTSWLGMYPFDCTPFSVG